MFRKNLYLIAILAAALMMTACNGGKAKDEKSESAINVEVEDSEETEEEEEEEVEPDAISEEDAHSLLEEKLEGLNCSAIYDSEKVIDDTDYYTYTVIDSEDNELKQMLAVDNVSGEVYVYDLDTDKISDFKEFALYNPDKDAEVSWEGKYKLDDMTVELEPGDGNSFEFSFSNEEGEKVFAGVAHVDGSSASYEDKDVSLEFSFESDGSLKIANNGNINAYAGIYGPVKE